jgi:hypothetical protein
MAKYPTLKEILLARFAKNSPWTVPYYKDPKVRSSCVRVNLVDGRGDEKNGIQTHG